MNEKFFSLPEKKQQAIINAGYRVFSRNSYNKSPMQEIADAAGISKSLLFHYFQNKKDLYMFLWERCADKTIECMTKYRCYEQKDLFECMYRGMQAKLYLMREYPEMAGFAVKAFYEKDPQIHTAVHESYRKYFDMKAGKTLMMLDSAQFVPGLDIKMMYRDMFLASEGYLWEKVREGNIDTDETERDFREMIEFWKSVYLKKEV